MNNRLLTQFDQRGVATLEFALSAAAFFMLLIMVIAGSVLFFTRSALVECTRRGARYASMQAAHATPGTARTTNGCDTTGPSVTAIKNVALYGNAAGTGPKLVTDLVPANICIEYSNFVVGGGTTSAASTVTVSITGYNYNFRVPGLNQTIAMPAFRSTVAGESAGVIP